MPCGLSNTKKEYRTSLIIGLAFLVFYSELPFFLNYIFLDCSRQDMCSIYGSLRLLCVELHLFLVYLDLSFLFVVGISC